MALFRYGMVMLTFMGHIVNRLGIGGILSCHLYLTIEHIWILISDLTAHAK